jgi:hypothetical protein
MNSIEYALRNIYVGDEEETKLLEDIDETVRQLKEDGISARDAIKIKKLLKQIENTKTGTVYWFLFSRVQTILEKYARPNDPPVVRATCSRENDR